MKISGRLLAALAAASVASHGFADVFEVEIGSFRFGAGTDDYEYVGDYGHLLGSDVDGVNHLRTVATFDLRGLMSMFPGESVQWITISDSGENFYNPNADPGADIDVFAVTGLPDYVDSVYTYDGPNQRYWDFTSSQLAAEVAVVDVDYGGGDAAPWWVSLGDEGSLTMWLDGWLPPNFDGDGTEPDQGSPSDGGVLGDEGSQLGDDSADKGDAEDGALDIFDGLESEEQDGEMILRDSNLFADIILRLNEVSPTAEWFNVTIGFDSMSTPSVVPGPGAIVVATCSLVLLGRRRR